MLAELSRTPFGHALLGLWDAFKADTGADLREFDDAIAAVNEFETLRYPDDVMTRGPIMNLAWAHGPRPYFAKADAPTIPQYTLVVSDVDRMAATIFTVCSRNLQFFTGGMNAYAREAVTYENEACAGWFT